MRGVLIIAALASHALGGERMPRFELNAAGMPAFAGAARFGMTRKEVAAAVPGFDVKSGATFLFDDEGHFDRLFVRVPGAPRDWEDVVAALGAMWCPPDLADPDLCVAHWWWPAPHVRAAVDACGPVEVIFEPYVELATLDVAALFALEGQTLAQAERTLRRKATRRESDGRTIAELRLAAYEIYDVILAADVSTGRLRDVELRIPFVGRVAATRLTEMARTARWSPAFASENGTHGYFWIRRRAR